VRADVYARCSKDGATETGMDSISSTLFLLLGLIALLHVGLHGTLVWENRRFAVRRLKKGPEPAEIGHVSLYAPCKGLDEGLTDNLRALFEQEYTSFDLTFVVESGDDPACPTIRRLMAEYPHIVSRVLVAGLATDSGQKVHNLLVATSSLDPDTVALAFVDSDARPHPGWLGKLVSRLDKSETGATTGYRWFIPSRPTLSNCLLHSVNCAVATLFGPGGHFLVWGGSWAIRRDTFEGLNLRDAWRGTLSDDLVASRVLRRAHLSIEFIPECMVASPLDADWSHMLEFIRRQYIIGRFYVPGYWFAALLVSTVANAAFWGSLSVGLIGLLVGSPAAHWALGLCGLLYAGHIARGLFRQSLGASYFPQRRQQMLWPARFDILAGPVISLANWLGLVSSCWGNEVRWRGVHYRLRRDGHITILGRTPLVEPKRDAQLTGPHFDRRRPKTSPRGR
jgi:hypothetical protein